MNDVIICEHCYRDLDPSEDVYLHELNIICEDCISDYAIEYVKNFSVHGCLDDIY